LQINNKLTRDHKENITGPLSAHKTKYRTMEYTAIFLLPSGEVNVAAPASLTVAIVITRLNVTATNLLFTIMSSFFIHATL
jgi:hypothetical protein